MSTLLLNCQDTTALLTDYLEGALPLLRRIQVSAHLAMCPPCRAFLDSLRQVPQRLGRVLAPEPAPRPALEGALGAALARIRAGESRDLAHPGADLFALEYLRPLLSAHLGHCAACSGAHPEVPPARPGGTDPLGPELRRQLPPESAWRWRRLGLGGSRVAELGPSPAGTLYLLHLPPGVRFPHHGHKAAEHAVLLQGHLQDGSESLGPGSFKTYAPGQDHAPEAKDEACWVLIHGEPEGLRFHGWRRIFG